MLLLLLIIEVNITKISVFEAESKRLQNSNIFQDIVFFTFHNISQLIDAK